MTARSATLTATRLLTRLQVTTGRLVLSVLVGGAVGVAALAANLGGNDHEVPTILVEVVLLIVTPVVSLVFAAASLGDPNEDGSLVYLWLRPIARWRLALAAMVASAVVTLPLNVGIAALVAGVGGRADLVVPAAAAAAGATVGYVALFVPLGLRTTRSLLWGLGYVLLIEGFLVRFSEQIAAVSIRRYSVSILTQLAEVDADIHEVSLGTAVIVLALLSALAFTACVRWLRIRDVE